jgi:hypothetical protein
MEVAMRQLAAVFSVLFLTVSTFAGQLTPNPLANGHSSSQVSELSSFANRWGTHTLYLWRYGTNNDLLTYNLHTYNGWTFADITYIIADSVDNSPVITGDDNKLLVVYARKSKIYLAQSTDLGNNWSTVNSFDFPSGDNTVYGMDALYKPSGDSAGLYVAYSTGHSGVNPEVYFKRFSLNSNQWTQIDTLTNEPGLYGTSPSITFSSSNIFISFCKTTSIYGAGQTKYRTRRFIDQSWNSTIDISSLSNNSGVSSIVADNSYLHALVIGFKSDGATPLYYIKKNLSTGDTTRTLLTGEGYYYVTPKLIKTADGTLNAFHVGMDASYNNFFEWQQYNGSSWSRVGNKWYPASNVMNDLSCCFVGNDIYAYKNYFYNGDWWIDTTTVWYNNGAPVTPTNLTFVSQNQVKPTWSYNPEPDINNYEVWRKYWRSQFDHEDWTLKSSPATNSWTDPDFQFNSEGDHYTVYYKLKAKDKANQYSSFTSELSTDAVMVFYKHGEIVERVTPKEFKIEQNYPNPFNPSTTIDYSIPLPSSVAITVFDRLGKEVATVINKEQVAGFYSVTFNASHLASGVYFYTVNAGSYKATRKMLLLK